MEQLTLFPIEDSAIEATDTMQPTSNIANPELETVIEQKEEDDRERVRKVVKWTGMSVKDFANTIEVLPATISHILGGRNKPSLDVMRGILSNFKDIAPEWLILGNGAMLREIDDSETTVPETIVQQQKTKREPIQEVPVSTMQQHAGTSQQQTNTNRHIARILICYSDGTYEER